MVDINHWWEEVKRMDALSEKVGSGSVLRD